MSVTSPYSPFKDTGQNIQRGLRRDLPPIVKICLVGNLVGDETLLKVIERLHLKAESSETGEDLSFANDILFVVEDFDNLHERFQSHHRILGPVALIQIEEKFGKIPQKLCQPLYTLSLYKKKICLFRFEKSAMAQMKLLINYMGGSVRPVVKEDISYLVTNSVSSDQYEKATELKIPAMQDKWVFELWNRRHNIDCCLEDDSLSKLKVSELTGFKIALWGYSESEELELEDIIQGLGSTSVKPSDPLCSHVVVNDDPKSEILELPLLSSTCKTVHPGWLLMCARMGIPACENNFIYEPLTPKKKEGRSFLLNTLKRKHDAPSPILEASPAKESPSTSEVKKSKTPRIFRIKGNKPRTPKSKTVPVNLFGEVSAKQSEEVKQTSAPCISPGKREKMRVRRRYKCEELYQTEKNYVGILNSIIELFQAPLEKSLREGKAILSDHEIKSIFHRLAPIVELHTKILSDLEPLISNWQDDTGVGTVFRDYSQEIIKVYPQYINHLDMIRSLIEEKTATCPEFQTFLKEAEANKACMRQELKDLIAWPMQRIGRVILLLQGILDDTLSGHNDEKPLKEAISSMEECGRQVNKGKRITEHVINKFELFNDIENCPLKVLKSKHVFEHKVIAYQVHEKEGTIKRSDSPICLLIFWGILEICKLRHNTFLSQSSTKRYKHVALYKLKTIKHVINITDQKNMFSLVFQPVNETSWRSIYSVSGEDVKTEDIVEKLALLIARQKLGSIEEVLRSMTLKDALNYFSQPDNQIAGSENCLPNHECPLVSAVPDTPERDRRFASPQKKTSAKGKLRRAWSTFLTPIQNIVSSSSNLPNMKAMGSTVSVGRGVISPPLVPPLDAFTTPVVGRRKLKSNSFQSKRL